MDKNHKIVLYSCLVMLIFCLMGWATSYDDDSQVESEAKKDMVAYMQSTFPLHFGSDLHAGDYVQYEIVDHHTQRFIGNGAKVVASQANGCVFR
ncbi:MAG TPA: hypothetical protein PLN17_05735 [Candidatus Cloacimonas sp.]|jgi:lipopolysaccharide export system protein LptC|nr:MAG: hypothetical protein BWX76_00535 [Candidatus Cloacimonetes bacterium ADurb.Bin089]HQJ96603.1 hypothetical protein [Candidatus Cloacimonas sp.]HQO18159.1 hypothetical protein [Candidatus Cloacimonas sp.]